MAKTKKFDKNSRRFFVKLKDNDKVTYLYNGRSYRRFLSRLQGAKDTMFGFQKSVYLKISYGIDECASGCVCESYNDIWVDNAHDLKQASEAFLEL